VKIPQDERFRAESRQYRLHFCCEECGLFDPDAGLCAHGYIPAEHLRSRYADPAADVVFCKEFDLA
jgi:hypothetical protein